MYVHLLAIHLRACGCPPSPHRPLLCSPCSNLWLCNCCQAASGAPSLLKMILNHGGKHWQLCLKIILLLMPEQSDGGLLATIFQEALIPLPHLLFSFCQARPHWFMEILLSLIPRRLQMQAARVLHGLQGDSYSGCPLPSPQRPCRAMRS